MALVDSPQEALSVLKKIFNRLTHQIGIDANVVDQAFLGIDEWRLARQRH